MSWQEDYYRRQIWNLSQTLTERKKIITERNARIAKLEEALNVIVAQEKNASMTRDVRWLYVLSIAEEALK